MEKRKTKTTKKGYYYITNFHEVDTKKDKWLNPLGESMLRLGLNAPFSSQGLATQYLTPEKLAWHRDSAMLFRDSLPAVSSAAIQLIWFALVAYLSPGSTSLTLSYLLCMSPASAGRSMV